jgi:hypothetical protein
VATVDFVHGGEVAHVCQEHRGANDMIESRARRAEERAEIAHDLLGLGRDIAVDQGTARRVDWDLA